MLQQSIRVVITIADVYGLVVGREILLWFLQRVGTPHNDGHIVYIKEMKHNLDQVRAVLKAIMVLELLGKFRSYRKKCQNIILEVNQG